MLRLGGRERLGILLPQVLRPHSRGSQSQKSPSRPSFQSQAPPRHVLSLGPDSAAVREAAALHPPSGCPPEGSCRQQSVTHPLFLPLPDSTAGSWGALCRWDHKLSSLLPTVTWDSHACMCVCVCTWIHTQLHQGPGRLCLPRRLMKEAAAS